MVPVMAHGALRYVTCLANLGLVHAIITSVPVYKFKYYHVCM